MSDCPQQGGLDYILIVHLETSDASRSVGEDPAAGSGVIAEVVTTGLSTSIKVSPFVPGGNMDSTPSTNMYVAIKNLSSTTQAITANLTILKLED